jgi:hypothetical protein
VVTVFQNTQVLLLASVLLIACLAKLMVREPASSQAQGVPLRRSRPVSVGLGLTEGGLGLALLLTSHVSVRLATTVAFAIATWAVGELRVRRPDAGCGCFGGLSTKRVDRRSVARAMLFTVAALASITAPHAGVDVLRYGTAQVGLVLAVELAVFAALSPELSVLLQRHAPEPCERRRSTLAESLATLHDSAVWVQHEDEVVSATPLDVWREGCWRFLVYPARVDEQPMEIVFAVSTAQRERDVRMVLVPESSGAL